MPFHSTKILAPSIAAAAVVVVAVAYIWWPPTERNVEVEPTASEAASRGQESRGRSELLHPLEGAARTHLEVSSSNPQTADRPGREAEKPWETQAFWEWIEPSSGSDGVPQLEEVMPSLMWGIATGNCNSYDKYVDMSERILAGYSSHFSSMGHRVPLGDRAKIADLAQKYDQELGLFLDEYVDATLCYRQLVLSHRSYGIARPGEPTQDRRGVGTFTAVCLGFKADFGWEQGLCPEYDQVMANMTELTESYKERAAVLLASGN